MSDTDICTLSTIDKYDLCYAICREVSVRIENAVDIRCHRQAVNGEETGCIVIRVDHKSGPWTQLHVGCHGDTPKSVVRDVEKAAELIARSVAVRLRENADRMEARADRISRRNITK